MGGRHAVRTAVAILLLAFMPLTSLVTGQTTSTEDDILRRIESALQTQQERAAQAAAETEDAAGADEAYRELVGTIQSQTEALWGRSAGRVLSPNVVAEEDAGDLLTTLLQEELGKPEIVAGEYFLRLTELIPADTPIDQLFQDLMAGQLGGLYNPENKQLYVIDTFDTQGFLGKVILSHEITHALQDTHFDLLEFYRNQENMDTMKARHAVLEGDATILMMEWAVEHGTAADILGMANLFTDQSEGLENAPPALVQDLLFSYMAGMNFCQAVAARYPDDWRRRVFESPPTMTRHILWPETYLADPRKEPVELLLGDLPTASDFEEVYRTPLGEWYLRLFLTPPDQFPEIGPYTLDPMIREPVAVEAASGWRGDILSVIARDGDPAREAALVWKVAFDGAEQTGAFTRALLRRFRTMENFRDAAVPPSIAAGTPMELAGARYTAFLLRARDQFFLVYAETPEALRAGKEMLAP